MSCWVVPIIAAELWGVPLEQVLGEIRAGAVISKLDYGFTLIDVAPDSRVLAPPPPRKTLPPPMTFIAAESLAAAEEIAEPLPSADACPATAVEPIVAADPLLAIEQGPHAQDRVPELTIEEEESEDGPDPNFGEPDDGQPLNWRAARTRAAAMRRRPPTRFN